MENFPSDCPFCQIQKSDPKKQIIAGQPASENFLAIRKLYPSKNVNFLVVSKVHVTNLKSGKNGVTRMVDMNDFVDFMNEFSKGKDWSIKINNGSKAGQEVFHFHAHISSNDKPEAWGI